MSDYHVMVCPVVGKWGVYRSGASRFSRLFDTQVGAYYYGIKLAKKNNVELYLHERTGEVADIMTREVLKGLTLA